MQNCGDLHATMSMTMSLPAAKHAPCPPAGIAPPLERHKRKVHSLTPVRVNESVNGDVNQNGRDETQQSPHTQVTVWF